MEKPITPEIITPEITPAINPIAKVDFLFIIIRECFYFYLTICQ
jgi:hypothetical protein